MARASVTAKLGTDPRTSSRKTVALCAAYCDPKNESRKGASRTNSTTEGTSTRIP